MPDLPTRLDYFNIGVDEVLARSAGRPPGQQFTEEACRTDGSDANLVIASGSAMAQETTRQLAIAIKNQYSDGARGIDLDRLVADRTNGEVVRKDPSPARTTLSITRNSGALPAVTVLSGTRVRARGTGIEFVLTAPASLPLGSTGPVTVAAQAVLAGLAGNVAEDSLTEWVASPPDLALTVTNPQVAAGGDERESDPRLAARFRSWWKSARRGIVAAIEFGALEVAGVRQAVAVEEVDSSGVETGRVALYIADAQGNGNSALVAAVRSSLREYRGAGVVVDIYGSQPQYVAIQLRLRFSANVDTTLAALAVAQSIVASVNALTPNAILPVSLLMAAARTVPGVIVLDDAILAPVGDLTPAPGAVIRTRLDLVTFE